MSFTFKLSLPADYQIRSAATWWQQHRTKAPKALSKIFRRQWISKYSRSGIPAGDGRRLFELRS